MSSTTTTTITIDLNGEEHHAGAGTSVRALVRETLHLQDDRVAIELNRQLLPRAQWDRVLAQGDRLEIVTFVGGG